MAYKCIKCGTNKSITWYYTPDGYFCEDCHEENKTNRLTDIKNSIKNSADWEAHSNEDMSEIFWRELAYYVKHPNRKSLALLRTCVLWACHDNHALSNSFHNALKWAKINLAVERARTDLPEE